MKIRKTIIVDISDTGEIKLETHGYIGRACLKESQFIKDLLGVELAKQLTPTYFQDEKTCVKKHLPLCG